MLNYVKIVAAFVQTYAHFNESIMISNLEFRFQNEHATMEQLDWIIIQVLINIVYRMNYVYAICILDCVNLRHYFPS